MLDEKDIIKFIDDDKNSKRKQNAKVGLNYYEGNHDIKNYKLYYFDADDNLQEDTTRSNIKISHRFFTELVDQQVQYMLSSSESFIKSDNPELQIQLSDYFDDEFKEELYNLLTGCVCKGTEYMYAFKSVDGRIKFQTADSMGVVEVRENQTDDETNYIIYWYVDRVGKDNKEVIRVQVWDNKQTTYYIRTDKGLILDYSEKINPRPHIIYRKPNDENIYYNGFGFIPFFRLDNSKKQVSGLNSVKGLIDDYDLMSCGLSNNLQDASEYLVVVSGFQGSDLSQLMQNIKTKKHIGVDNGGNVDYKTVSIPYEARKVKLELDEKNIYKFGMGFNSSQIGDGNITNIVIKSRYALLDMKCNKLEIRLRRFLKRLISIVLDDINSKNNTDYKLSDVYLDFKREIMTNASDNATIEKIDAEKEQIKVNTILNLSTVLGNETTLQLICEVLDIDYNDVKDKVDDLELLEKDLEGVEVEQ